MSDTNTAAIVAALETLGAEIERLSVLAEARLNALEEREDDVSALHRELLSAQQQADAATKQAAAEMSYTGWENVQRIMVQSGIQSVRRLDTFRWRAVSEGREWVGDSLAEAATAAANAWAVAHGKVEQA